MPRLWTSSLLALALTPAFAGCCPDSCSDCVEPALTETVRAPTPYVGGGIVSLNGFVENKGQWPAEVLFFARRGGVEATVLCDALIFRPVRPSEDVAAPRPLVFHLPGNAQGRVVEGLDRLVTKHHFLLGDRHASDAAGFERVALREVLPGVDIVLQADGGVFEYDLVIAPGTSLDDFVVEVEGAGSLEIREPDVLVLHTEVGEVEQHIRASWQGHQREAVACKFRVLEGQDERHRFGFEAPSWDRDLALVLDPDLVYLTYVGGSGQDTLVEVEVDDVGATYLLAKTATSMPVTPGSLKGTPQGQDAWVGKLSPDGSNLEWACFLGGAATEDPKDLALDTDGTIVLVGRTWSPDFPTTSGAYQTTLSHGTAKSDVFVSRLDPNGSSLVWSTFYGGIEHDKASVCALYPLGDVLVAFEPVISDPPSTAGVIDEVFDSGDLALFRLTKDGTQCLWQTYFRASSIYAMIVDENSNAYFGGSISYADAPLMTTPGAFKESMADGDTDAFVTKMNSGATQLLWSTYLGGDPNDGTGSDYVHDLALDASHAVYAVGRTGSASFPVTPGAFQLTQSGSGGDGFAAKLLPNGGGLAWATYLGADGFPGFTHAQSVAVDQAGNTIVLAVTNEPNFPVTPDAFQPTFVGGFFANTDALLCKIDSVGESLLYATWFGWDGSEDWCQLIADADGDAYLALQTFASDMPSTPGAFQPAYGGSGDLAVAKFDFEPVPWTVLQGGLSGVGAPSLVGLGELTVGASTRLALRGALPIVPAWLVVGTVHLGLPFLSGTLIPYPTIVIPLTTDPTGGNDLGFAWPAAPAGVEVFFQVWAPDAGAPQGWSASNGLMAKGQ